MQRRTAGLLVVVAFAFLSAPLTADTSRLVQHVPVIGILTPQSIPELITAFRQGLRDLGYVEGHNIGCSSATTLIMNRLEFCGQELSKRPDMIGQSSGHARGAVAPLGLDQS